MRIIRFFEMYTDKNVLKSLISTGFIENMKAITKLSYANTRILPKPDPRHNLTCICTPSLYHNKKQKS